MTRVYISSQSPILSFGEKTGQFARERHVRQVVVPDGVVQAERLVAAAPLSRRAARAGRRRSSVTPSWRSRAPSAMPPWPPPIDHDVGLRGRGRGSLDLGARASPATSPGPCAAPCSTPFGRLAPWCSSWPLSSSSVVSSVQAPSVVQPQQARAAPDRGLERDPRRRSTPSASAGSSPSAIRKSSASVVSIVCREQVGDPVAALDGLDVPGERDEVAPEAGRGEQARRALGVPGGERGLEVGQPPLDPLAGADGSATAVGSRVCVIDVSSVRATSMRRRDAGNITDRQARKPLPQRCNPFRRTDPGVRPW